MCNMTSALIGHTGFVGGTLASQFRFDDMYHTDTITQIAGKTYDLLVVAAAPGAKWIANQNPEADLASISALVSNLKTVEASEVIVVSTIDVYPIPIAVTEDDEIDISKQHPYGEHRLWLERELEHHFETVRVCRLPALFGPGLKKNFIFDLIHQRMLQYTHPKSQFQFYDLSQLWHDIEWMRQKKLSLINLVTEPIVAEVVAQEALGIRLDIGETATLARYDVWTKHASNGHYIATADEVLEKVVTFIRKSRAQL